MVLGIGSHVERLALRLSHSDGQRSAHGSPHDRPGRVPVSPQHRADGPRKSALPQVNGATPGRSRGRKGRSTDQVRAGSGAVSTGAFVGRVARAPPGPSNRRPQPVRTANTITTVSANGYTVLTNMVWM